MTGRNPSLSEMNVFRTLLPVFTALASIRKIKDQVYRRGAEAQRKAFYVCLLTGTDSRACIGEVLSFDKLRMMVRQAHHERVLLMSGTAKPYHGLRCQNQHSYCIYCSLRLRASAVNPSFSKNAYMLMKTTGPAHHTPALLPAYSLAVVIQPL